MFSLLFLGDLRLYSGSATNLGATGVLQISENGSWQRLCSNNFNDTHAVIACKELGYQYGYVLPDAAFGEIVLGSSDLYKGTVTDRWTVVLVLKRLALLVIICSLSDDPVDSL